MLNFINCKPSIQDLYDSRFNTNENNQFKVTAKFKESLIHFGIVLTGSDKTPDCKISSFGENIYFRTQNGENRKQYKTIPNLMNAVKNIALKYGYTLEVMNIQHGEPDRF